MQANNWLFEVRAVMADNVEVTDRKTFPAIADRLGALRAAFSDDNRTEWAARHKFNTTQYINWENGSRRIPLEAAESLCLRYGLTLDWIYLGRLDGLSETARRALSSTSRI